MIRKLLYWVAIGLVPACAIASTSTVTATVSDTDGQRWTNGSWFAQIIMPGGVFSGTKPTIGGAIVPSTARGNLDATGIMTAVLTDTSSLDQSGVQWQITVCPNASVTPYGETGCSLLAPRPIVGATVDLTAYLNAVVAPRFPAGTGAFGYSDAEVRTPSVVGVSYFNTSTDPSLAGLRLWDGHRWVGGGGLPLGPAGGDLTGTYPNPTLVTTGVAAGSYSNPSITVDAKGRVTSASSGPNSTNVNGQTCTLGSTCTVTAVPGGSAGGDLTGTYPNPSLVTTGVSAGSYSNSSITVDAKGRVTSASSGPNSTMVNGQACALGSTCTVTAVPGGSAGGDLSGSYPNPSVAKLNGNPITNTTPTNNSMVPTWNGSAYNARQLSFDDLTPAFAINSFTGGQTVEIGASIVNPAFNATYSYTPTVGANITNTDGISSPTNLSSPYTSGTVLGTFTKTTQACTTFTLTATATTTKTATQQLCWSPRVFGGIGSAGATSATASGTNGVLGGGGSGTLSSAGISNSQVNQVFGPYSPANQKIYLLVIGNGHTNIVDNLTGFAMPFNTPNAVTFVNQNGSSVAMYLYESTNLLNGTFSPKLAN